MKTTLLSLALLWGVAVGAFAQATIPPPWHDIQLTGATAKIVAVPTPPDKKKLPLWIPVGGALVAGGGIYWLLPDNREQRIIPVVAPDNVTVPCGIPGTFFDPLFNDRHVVAIASVAPVSGATISITDDGLLLITADGSVERIDAVLQVVTETGRVEDSFLSILVTRTPLNLGDDTGQTPFATPWTGNVLANDTATDPVLVSLSQPEHGTATFAADGTVTYTPPPGFSGTVSFAYTVRASCGQEATATVRIEVLPCIAETEVITEPAVCDMANGSATLGISPPGDYQYTWPDGNTAAQRTDLAAGSYVVTVTGTAAGCSETVALTVPIVNLVFLTALELVQAGCATPAEVHFVLQSADQPPPLVTIDSPEGTFELDLPAGAVSLGEFFDLIPGDYRLRAGTSEACSTTLEFTLNPAPAAPQIGLQSSTPPSGPSTADGSVTISITSPGTPPYAILHNGEQIGSFLGEETTIGELGWGDHQFRIRSEDGCISNSVAVSFAQVRGGWGVSGLLAPPATDAATGTVEHPAPGSPERATGWQPGIRLAYRSGRQRTLLNAWLTRRGALALAFSPQVSGRVGPFELHSGPGLRLPTAPESRGRLTWRWTTSVEWGLPGGADGFLGIEARLEPGGWNAAFTVSWCGTLAQERNTPRL